MEFGPLPFPVVPPQSLEVQQSHTNHLSLLHHHCLPLQKDLDLLQASTAPISCLAMVLLPGEEEKFALRDEGVSREAYSSLIHCH